jgi:hypothetical protein
MVDGIVQPACHREAPRIVTQRGHRRAIPDAVGPIATVDRSVK